MSKNLISRRQTKQLITLAIALVSLGLAYSQQNQLTKTTVKLADNKQPGLYKVTTFTDGDTISVDIDGTTEKVRFIGVDTPETHDPRKAVQCFGQKAADFTKALIGSNQVKLEADATNSDRDRYNRLLRYVYLSDGTLVNAEIIKQGYGFAYVLYPFTKIDEFREYEKTARENNLGLWGSCTPTTGTNGQIKSNDQ